MLIVSAAPFASAGETKATPDPVTGLIPTEQAIERLEQRIKQKPKDFLTLTMLGQLHVRRAHETGNLDAYKRARSAFEAALAAYPDYVPAMGELAAVQLSLHRFGEARELARKILAKDPASSAGISALGDAELALGNLEAAAKAFDQLLMDRTFGRGGRNWRGFGETMRRQFACYCAPRPKPKIGGRRLRIFPGTECARAKLSFRLGSLTKRRNNIVPRSSNGLRVILPPNTWRSCVARSENSTKRLRFTRNLWRRRPGRISSRRLATCMFSWANRTRRSRGSKRRALDILIRFNAARCIIFIISPPFLPTSAKSRRKR